MENFKINVVDGIMGSGKSSAIINLIKMHKHDYPESHFLIIVPYLTEINRYSKELQGFKSIVTDTLPKKVTLKKLLQNKKDIICTHSLFLQNPDLINELATDYILIVDEALNSLISPTVFPNLLDSNNLKNDIVQEDNNFTISDKAHTYTFTNWDIDNMISNKFLIKSSTNENLLTWNTSNETTSIYSSLEDYFKQYDVYCFSSEENNSNYYVTLFPIKAFNIFKNIYVLTYIWDAQIMKAYFDFYGAQYNYLYPIPHITISDESNKFVGKLGENSYYLLHLKKQYYNTESIILQKARLNISIPSYKLDEYNLLVKDSDSRCALFNNIKPNLSYTFYTTKLNSDIGLDFLKTIKKNIKNLMANNVPRNLLKNAKIIWTVYDCAKEDISKGCRYINLNNYIPINTKATNEYKDSNILIYLVNRYLNPCILNFITKYCNSDFNMDLYSLSELIQWIWRSAIRDDKAICIYIPSSRMLNLFLEWINASSTDEFKNSILEKHKASNISNNSKSDNSINQINI